MCGIWFVRGWILEISDVTLTVPVSRRRGTLIAAKAEGLLAAVQYCNLNIEFSKRPSSFPGTKMLLGIPLAILGMGGCFPEAPILFLGTFWLLGKAPSFLGTG